MEPLLEPVTFRANQILVSPGQPIDFVYFLRSGLATLTCSAAGRQTAVALIGPEGFTGHPLLLGHDTDAHPTLMQIAGSGYRMRAADLLRLTERDPALRLVFLQAVHELMEQIAETAFANAQLTVEARLARLLLMTADRLGQTDVPLTHDRIALMLGCRRAGVTMSMHLLEGEKAIRAGRGKILIVDRNRLFDAAGSSFQHGLPHMLETTIHMGLPGEVRPS
jgi:CRP-like cAMP-binding protein